MTCCFLSQWAHVFLSRITKKHYIMQSRQWRGYTPSFRFVEAQNYVASVATTTHFFSVTLTN